MDPQPSRFLSRGRSSSSKWAMMGPWAKWQQRFLLKPGSRRSTRIYVEGIGTRLDTFLQVHNISIYVALQVPIYLCPYGSPSYCCYQQYSTMVYGAPGHLTSMKGISYIGYINPYPLSGRTTWRMQQHMDNGSWLRPHSCRCNYGMWVSTFWSNWLNSWQLTEKTNQRNGTFNMVLSQ